MQRENKVTRVCFNFSSPCNMACKYCYIPFDHSIVVEDLCYKIVDRCAELGAEIITFGGADPFTSSFFIAICEHASRANLKIHIDTNGIRLKDNDMDHLCSLCDIIALSLDGPDEETHTCMRGLPGHFWTVQNRLLSLHEFAAKHNTRIKINTVVAQPNLESIVDMVPLINKLRVDIWSLYEFWPLERGADYKAKFQIDRQSFDNLIDVVRTKGVKATVEVSSVRSRHNSYFFVDNSGNAYTHGSMNDESYHRLGSIFDEEIIERWASMTCSSLRDEAVHRYR